MGYDQGANDRLDALESRVEELERERLEREGKRKRPSLQPPEPVTEAEDAG